MRRHGVWVATVVAAAVVGCGPGKELPGEVIPPQVAPTVEPDPLGPVPARSDPDAKAVLDRAVKAVTQGDPSRLARVKASVVTYKGGVHFPNTPSMTDATFRLEAAWPDRALVTFQFKGTFPAITFRLLHRDGWMTTGGVDQGANPADVGPLVYADIVAKYALPLGLPLVDDRTVAFGVKKGAGGTVVKVAPPDAPVLLVTFDDKSGLPTRVEYNPLELNKQRVAKVATFADYKPQDGLLIPTTVELTQNARPAEKWTLEKWEFPEKIDPALFETPK